MPEGVLFSNAGRFHWWFLYLRMLGKSLPLKITTLLVFFLYRVWIISSHFTNCKVSSSYCDCKVVNHTKIAKQFLTQRKFNSYKLYFSSLYPYFIHHCTLLSKEILLIPKTTPQNPKNASQFLKYLLTCSGVKALLHLTYLLQSEFQTIIQTLL